ncbi:uncharacterized protein LOC110011182 [Jatropha curcas]|uniref:uncharacterized protein LOC110011182 n=1 Tax=Jatropha curcas TaxID=180498 RepID=UPI001892D31F|nr:uncharacterized protein LOC110011182 [Jatropha curcas]
MADRNNKPNPYQKPTGDYCYRCKKQWHTSNICPEYRGANDGRRQVNVVDEVAELEEVEDEDDGSLAALEDDSVSCDVVDMDACGVLLGRPWQVDVDALHKGRENSYLFTRKNKKIIILPSGSSAKASKVEGKSIIVVSSNVQELTDVIENSGGALALLIKPKIKFDVRSLVPPLVKELLDEFHTLVEEPSSFPPFRDIQHQIDFILGSKILNLPHYRMNPKESQILQEQVEELLKKGHIQESISPCGVPALLVPKKDGT